MRTAGRRKQKGRPEAAFDGREPGFQGRETGVALGSDLTTGVGGAPGEEARATPVLRPKPLGFERQVNPLHLRRSHDELREGLHPGLESRVREWGVVGGDLVLGQVRRAARDQRSHLQVGMRADVLPPGREAGARRDPRRQDRVHGDEAREPVAEPGIDREGESDQHAPVLDNERQAAEIQPLDQPQKEVAVEAERVIRVPHRLVGAAEPKKSGATTRAPEPRNTGIMRR